MDFSGDFDEVVGTLRDKLLKLKMPTFRIVKGSRTALPNNKLRMHMAVKVSDREA